MKKVEIIPAILTRDFAELSEKLELIKGSSKSVQIDVSDGQFTPEATWPYRKHDYSFDQILKEEKGMPHWESFDFEIDLMANKPEEKVSEWVSAGATRIIIHVESKGDVARAIDSIVGTVEVGVAINIDTPIQTLDPYLSKIDFIQCMGIAHIGFQGQDFDEKVIEKVRQLRQRTSIPISVDGGVNLKNATLLVEAGVSRLVVGSAIFASDNPIEAIQKFKRIISIPKSMV